jgi:hypothetical protein
MHGRATIVVAPALLVSLTLATLPAQGERPRATPLPAVASCAGRAAAFDLAVGVRVLDAGAISLELPEGPRRISDADSAVAVITTVVNRHRISHLDSEEPHPIPLSVIAEPHRDPAAVFDWIARIDHALPADLRSRVRWVIAAAAPATLCAFPFRVGKPAAAGYHRWDEVVAAARRQRQPLTLGK